MNFWDRKKIFLIKYKSQPLLFLFQNFIVYYLVESFRNTGKFIFLLLFVSCVRVYSMITNTKKVPSGMIVVITFQFETNNLFSIKKKTLR